jgi:hypothetical protein
MRRAAHAQPREVAVCEEIGGGLGHLRHNAVGRRLRRAPAPHCGTPGPGEPLGGAGQGKLTV